MHCCQLDNSIYNSTPSWHIFSILLLHHNSSHSLHASAVLLRQVQTLLLCAELSLSFVSNTSHIIGGEPISVLLLASIVGSSLVEQYIVILLLGIAMARADNTFALWAPRFIASRAAGRMIYPILGAEVLS